LHPIFGRPAAETVSEIAALPVTGAPPANVVNVPEKFVGEV